jgi:5-methylcytosine-specific restriction endonuclease McrA
MKRLNPNTGAPFKRGDLRKDGLIFLTYYLKITKKDGYFEERWTTKETLVKHDKNKILWAKANPIKRKNSCSKWQKLNPAKNCALSAKRHASKIQRTPQWLTPAQISEIQALYVKAKQLEIKTGIKHHVDHIIPLRGENVSGLHVPWNLQVLTASQNQLKSNKV